MARWLSDISDVSARCSAARTLSPFWHATPLRASCMRVCPTAKELPVMKRKLIGWIAAGVLAGAPAIGMARTHHVTAAAPTSAVSESPAVAKPVAKTKLIAHKKKAIKGRKPVKKHKAKHRATKTRHTRRHAVKKTKKA